MSIPKLSMAGLAVLLSVFLQPWVQGASMHGGIAESRHSNPYFTPSSNMLKALQYIQNLRQQAGEEPITEDDARELVDASEGQDSKDRQWLNALLRTLPQTRVEPKATLPKLHYTPKNRENIGDGEQPMLGDIEDYADYPKPPEKYGLMFEDEEPHGSASKRANEAAELQYTPQSLANLQSVFEELEKIKHQNLGQDQTLDWSNPGNSVSIRDVSYKDGIGVEQWIPMEERMEMEEVVNDSREEFDRSLEDNHSDGGNSKQSTQPTYGNQEDQDDLSKLLDEYLLKILHKTPQTEKRDEEQNSKRRIAQLLQKLDPIVIYKLMEISQKLQIHPEDLIEMVMDGKVTKDDKMPKSELEPEPLLTDEEKLARIVSYNGEKRPETRIFKAGFPKKQAKTPDNSNVEDILGILGLESPERQNAEHFEEQGQFRDLPSRYAPPGGRPLYIPPKPYKGKDNYDGNVDEDLVNFLTAKMLAQNSKQTAQKADQHTPKPQEHLNYGAYESVLKDYFDQPENEKSSLLKTRKPTKYTVQAPKAQGLEDDRLLEMSYLIPKSEKQLKNLYDKTVRGM
ncbi:secretogranin-2b-like [Paramormyrops kingsleyae]|uniref:Secretogranin-2-like n=1 Tax=Paramormyrops kingsleyae TaxID=1676925 RepID=A0A3B3RYH7_9TELE|nr:secretogranin-2-like [Paramormyrops kingsleyae]XP_023674525.1 secretogranin-2-like [Paramormyrops kingsleyae]